MSESDRVPPVALKNDSASSVSRAEGTRNIDPDTSFLPVVEGAVAANPLATSWYVEEKTQSSMRWLWVYNNASGEGRAQIPEQGWKLHVSASMRSAGDVLERALPILLAEATAFKVAATPRQLGFLNSGSGGMSQVGKFITIYPQDDSQAVRLAAALDGATMGLRGPAVPSDRPLRPGSLVHYRYGAFFHLGMQDAQGDVLLAIRTPSGELLPDKRSSFYSPPDWATDPFLEIGVAQAISAPEGLVNGRYLLVTIISETARGNIYQSIDVAGMRRCILKRARRDGMLGWDGTDAFDRLRNEARNLALLAPDPRFPQAFETFELNGDLFLAMEEVVGESLEEHLRALAQHGRTLTLEELVRWGKELASMLGYIHEKGLIYRDLKASNVIVAPDGLLHLIDFDVSMEFPAEHAQYSPGTIGYMSRRQEANEPPQIEHDIYALGALLYFMATGADPSRFPHPFDLLRRPLELLNPDLPPGMAEIIRRCLAPDSEEHFTTMEAVGDALTAVAHEAQGAVRQRKQVAATIAPYLDYVETARRLGDTLCMFAEPDPFGHGCYWRDPRYSEIPVIARDLATGSAGPVLALAELVAELGDEKHREYLRDGARWLVHQPYMTAYPRPGLYNGEGGVAIALLRAGQVLKEDGLIAEAVDRGRWLASLPFVTPGIFNGTAGRVRFHVLLWDATGDETHLDAAIAAAEHLLRTALVAQPHEAGESPITRARDEGPEGEAASEMLCWAMPPGDGPHDGRIYTGYALGAAGIGDAFLDLLDVTGDQRFLQAAQGAARWLESLALPALNDGSGLDWPQVDGETLKGAFWGHGASGIGIFLLNAIKHGLLSRPDEMLEGAVRTAALGTRWAGPTLAYGLGGPIEFLLDAYQQHPAGARRIYLQYAEELAGILNTFSTEKHGYLAWPSEDPTLLTPDFIVGYAGIATCMLRLAMPDSIPRVATIAASRRNRLQSVHAKKKSEMRSEKLGLAF